MLVLGTNTKTRCSRGNLDSSGKHDGNCILLYFYSILLYFYCIGVIVFGILYCAVLYWECCIVSVLCWARLGWLAGLAVRAGWLVWVAFLAWSAGGAVGAGRSVWLAWLARLAGLCLQAFPFSGVFILVSLELAFLFSFFCSLFLHVCALQQGNMCNCISASSVRVRVFRVMCVPFGVAGQVLIFRVNYVPLSLEAHGGKMSDVHVQLQMWKAGM